MLEMAVLSGSFTGLHGRHTLHPCKAAHDVWNSGISSPIPFALTLSPSKGQRERNMKKSGIIEVSSVAPFALSLSKGSCALVRLLFSQQGDGTTLVHTNQGGFYVLGLHTEMFRPQLLRRSHRQSRSSHRTTSPRRIRYLLYLWATTANAGLFARFSESVCGACHGKENQGMEQSEEDGVNRWRLG
jgi:hypothetical protein